MLCCAVLCCAMLCCAVLCCAVLCDVQCHAWLCCSALGWCRPNGLLLLSCCFDAAYCSALLCCAVLCCAAAVLCCALQCFVALCCCCWRFSAPLSCYFVAKMRCTPISCFFGAGGTILLSALRFFWNTCGILHEYFTISLRFWTLSVPALDQVTGNTS